MKTTIKLVVLFLVLVLAYLIFDYSEGKKDEKRRALFSKVQKGMSKTDVIDILGKPYTVLYGIDSSGFYFEYFTKEYEGIGKSGTPTVVFDSSGKVSFTSFGD
mgnify:CR=1 FL=1